MYDDIIDLNFDQPALFTTNKLAVKCYFRYYDSHATIWIGVDFLPREFEYFNFFFIKAKMGIDRFWVSRIEHELLETGVQTTLWLEGGSLNRFREMAVEEGLFKGWLHFRDKWDKASFEIDDIILDHIRR
ncbi:MAG: hypothetical protein EOP48_27930 [Sphingobacteriales bacterium]|nr:MAG: hypothetical protein EOP48_27930 [Sphingobacteriales bacterium]